MKKTIISLMLVITMLLTMIPGALAEPDNATPQPESEGTSTVEDQPGEGDPEAQPGEELEDELAKKSKAAADDDPYYLALTKANFPDDRLRNAVKDKLNSFITEDESGVPYVSKAGVLGVTEFDFYPFYYIYGVQEDPDMKYTFTSIKGLELFPNLEKLICKGRFMTSLDLSGCSNLRWVDCGENKLTSLTISENNAKLSTLSCAYNPLQTLDVSNAINLNSLNCSHSHLSSLILPNTSTLSILHAEWSHLEQLVLPESVNLAKVYLNTCQLKTLDLSGQTNLRIIKCDNNFLSTVSFEGLPLLNDLDVSYNDLENLTLSDLPALTTLSCNDNQLTSLDLSGCPMIQTLDVSNNKLPTLDISHCSAVSRLLVSGNRMPYLDLTKHPKTLSMDANYTNLHHVSGQGSIQDGQYSFDLTTLVPADLHNRVTLITSNLTLDSTGKIALPFALEAIVYQFLIQERLRMRVEVSLTYTDAPSPSPTPMGTASTSPTPTPTPIATTTASPTPSPTASPSASPTATATASASPTATASASPSPTPTTPAGPTPSPTPYTPPSGENVIRFGPDDLPTGQTVEVDGVSYPLSGDGTVILPDGVKAYIVTEYTYNKVSQDLHEVYPTTMRMWQVMTESSRQTARRLAELDDVLQYSGSSIRITGNKGIRMITSVPKDKKKSLTSKNGLSGWTLLEYGTVVAWDNELGGDSLTLEHPAAKRAYAYKKNATDPIFKDTGKLIQYTNVLVGMTNEKCVPDLAMRPYMILENPAKVQVKLYGGTIHRSIGYIAYQNRKAFQPGTASYKFIWDIIHFVYGDAYDADYKK